MGIRICEACGGSGLAFDPEDDPIADPISNPCLSCSGRGTPEKDK